MSPARPTCLLSLLLGLISDCLHLLLQLPPHGLCNLLAELCQDGPHGLRNVPLQGLAQERPGTRRLFCLRCHRLRGLPPLLRLRLRDAFLGLGPLVLLRLLPRLLHLGDHPASLIKDRGRGHVLLCRRLRGALLPLWLLFLLPLLLLSLSLGPALLPRLLYLGDHSALLIKDIGRGRDAPLPRFGVLLVHLLRRCQQQAFQTVKTLLQLVPVLLPFPFR
ncbi:MAG TPA: hypothetical protein VKF37_07995 [Chloroflexota bacterium]|nr:hypothetical protein [Chloroflexota bacterium]